MKILTHIKNLFSKYKEVETLPDWVIKKFSKKKKENGDISTIYKFKGKHNKYKIEVQNGSKIKYFKRKREWIKSDWHEIKHFPKWVNRKLDEITDKHDPPPGIYYIVKIKGKYFEYKYQYGNHALYPYEERLWKRRRTHKN